jgi:hypothetical protein
MLLSLITFVVASLVSEPVVVRADADEVAECQKISEL